MRPARVIRMARLLLHVEHAARHRQRRRQAATASSSTIRWTRPRCSARCSSRWTSGSTRGTPPPPSRVPRLADGTLVPPLPQAGMGFPNIPGVTYTGLMTTRYLFNYGPRFDQGIMDHQPADGRRRRTRTTRLNGPIYPQLMSRRPTATATTSPACGCPTYACRSNTYTGWALRAGRLGETTAAKARDSASRSPATKAAREASGDPRLVGRRALPELHRLLLQGHAGGERLRRGRLHAAGRRARDDRIAC